MAQSTEKILAYRSLHESALVRISEYRCRAHRGGPEAEEYSDGNNIVLMRTGAFSKHFGRRSVTADVNQAAFFTKGSTYRVSHPSDCGDRGVVFNPSAEVLLDIIREFDPTIDEHPEQPFPFVTGPCDPSRYWRLHALTQNLTQALSGPIAELSVEIEALDLIADVVGDAFERRGNRKEKRRRVQTEADHIDRVEAVKCWLAANLGEVVTLDRIARAVGSSSFHLARLFQSRTGVSIHRYLTRLRLRASLQRLAEAEGADDLTSLALDLGFSSHSHFSSAFRREFGCTPSDARRSSLQTSLLEISKNLTAYALLAPYHLLVDETSPPQARPRFAHHKRQKRKPDRFMDTPETTGFLKKGMIMEKTLKCPVCDWEIKDEGIKVQVGGKDITVCCDECAEKAKKG